MLNELKILLDIDNADKDDLLTLLIETTIDEVRSYIHTHDIEGLELIILEMCVFKYNQIGSEGLSSENYNGASFNYMDAYPEHISSALKAKRKIRLL